MSRFHLLLAEADVLVRHPLAEYLRECGYHVLEAADAAEARLLLANQATPVDIVLADAGLPPEGGFALAAWIRGQYPDVQVILAGTVARTTEKAADLCEEGPALSKPYDHQRILDHIRRLRAARDRGGSGA